VTRQQQNTFRTIGSAIKEFVARSRMLSRSPLDPQVNNRDLVPAAIDVSSSGLSANFGWYEQSCTDAGAWSAQKNADTHARGLANYRAIEARVINPALASQIPLARAAGVVASARTAARAKCRTLGIGEFCLDPNARQRVSQKWQNRKKTQTRPPLGLRRCSMKQPPLFASLQCRARPSFSGRRAWRWQLPCAP
jgi:hypothetical protein